MSENPKRAASAHKIRFHGIPAIVEAEIAAVMTSEGGRKYSCYNYRETPVKASDYYDAIRRHLTETWELGEEIDGPSGVAHLTKLICSAIVWRDAQINGMLDDDRPPPVDRKEWERVQKIVGELNAKYPNPEPSVRMWGLKLTAEIVDGPKYHVLQETHVIAPGGASTSQFYTCPACYAYEGGVHKENCPRGRKFSAGQVRT